MLQEHLFKETGFLQVMRQPRHQQKAAWKIVILNRHSFFFVFWFFGGFFVCFFKGAPGKPQRRSDFPCDRLRWNFRFNLVMWGCGAFLLLMAS